MTYICPWQTRLRCLTSYRRVLADPDSALFSLIPPGAEQAATSPPGARPAAGGAAPGAAQAPPRLHILASAWAVPLAWFVPFAGADRWLALGPGSGPPSDGQATSATRALLYTTPMSRARRRVARGLVAFHELGPQPAGPDWDPVLAQDELGEVGRWLEGFHPYSLVELDYGGLVQLLSDDALSRDQSAAEIRAAIDGMTRGQRELAVAMYQRAHSRWRAIAEYEVAN